MESIKSRLARLEASAARHGTARPGGSTRLWERFLHAHDNGRRELHGLELLPELPYQEEDYEDDLKTLEEHLPALREDAGWQTEEAQAFLDSWERDLTEKLNGKD